MRASRLIYVENDPALRGIMVQLLKQHSEIELLLASPSPTEVLADDRVRRADVALIASAGPMATSTSGTCFLVRPLFHSNRHRCIPRYRNDLQCRLVTQLCERVRERFNCVLRLGTVPTLATALRHQSRFLPRLSLRERSARYGISLDLRGNRS